MRRSRADRNGLLERSRKRLRVPSLSRQERRPRDRGRCGGCGLPRGSDGAELPAGSDGGPLPGGPESSRTDCGGAASSDGSGVSVEGLFPARAAVLHIRERLSRRPVRGFPHDSGTPTRMSVLSGRAPMCRATPSAHGRISPALNARTFPHDSADPSLAGPGRMCNTASAAPMPHIRGRRRLTPGSAHPARAPTMSPCAPDSSPSRRRPPSARCTDPAPAAPARTRTYRSPTSSPASRHASPPSSPAPG